MKIDTKTYKIDESNHYKTQNVKNQIILSISQRKDNYHIVRLKHKDFGKTKKWNTFTISRNGSVYQHYNPKYHTDFLGIKEVDKHAISIVLENMGALYKTADGKYLNWLNEICQEKNIVEKKYLGYNFWENFTKKQIESTAKLCIKLSKEFNIPLKCIDFQYYHKDINKFRGIVFKSNYVQDYFEANPLFDIEKFNEMLQIFSLK